MNAVVELVGNARQRPRSWLQSGPASVLWVCLWMSAVSGCDTPEVPTEAYAAAMKAYEATTLLTLSSAGADPRWDDVVAQLRAVPESNATEHRKAMALADSIEARQRQLAGIEKRSGAAADDYLRGLAERRPTATDPTHRPLPTPTRGAAPGGTPTRAPGGGRSPQATGGGACAADCQAQEDRCFGSAGCKRMGTTWMCTDDASARSGWCHQQARTCRTGCSGGAAPSSGAGCRQACEHQANGCYLAVPGCLGSGTNWTCDPGSSARGNWCASQLGTCRQQCG